MWPRMLGGVAAQAAWLLQYYAVLLPLAMSTVAIVDSGRRLPPVYWNSSNPIFYARNTQNVIDVNMWDTLEIVCPHYNSSLHVANWEYYVIYMVNRTEFETCIINNTAQVRIVLNCSDPTKTKTYTMPIWPYQAVPGNPDFMHGQSYYFITTSGGAYHEMQNQYHGACQSNNMKIILNVCCSDTGGKPNVLTPKTDPVVTTYRPTTRTPPTTPRPSTTTKHRTTVTTTARTTRKDDFLGDKTIHAGGREKNTGMISDSGGGRLVTSCWLLLLLLLVALLGTLLTPYMCR